MIKRFKNNDEEYKLWCNSNKQWHMFNYFGRADTSADMNKIHKAICPILKKGE